MLLWNISIFAKQIISTLHKFVCSRFSWPKLLGEFSSNSLVPPLPKMHVWQIYYLLKTCCPALFSTLYKHMVRDSSCHEQLILIEQWVWKGPWERVQHPILQRSQNLSQAFIHCSHLIPPPNSLSPGFLTKGIGKTWGKWLSSDLCNKVLSA